MANQKLVLEAELRDGITASLKKIQNQLNSIRETPGMSAANGWLGKLGKEAKEFQSAGEGAVNIISGLGIGGLAAGASLAAMTSALKGFVANKAELSEVARQMEINVDVLNRYEKAGEHFAGVTDGAMEAMIKSLNDRLPEIRLKTGEMFKELSGAGYTDLRDRLAGGEGLSDAIMDVLKKAEQVGKQYGPRVQKQFLDQMFPGNGDIAERLMGDGGVAGFQKQLDEVSKKLNPISPEMIKAQQEFRDAQRDFNMALENFENKVGPGFLHMLSKIEEDLAILFGGVTPEKQKELDKADQDRYDKFQYFWGSFKEWWNEKHPPKTLNPDGSSDDDPKPLHKSSYDGSGFGNLLQNTAYVEGGGSPLRGSAEEVIAGGTKTGVLAAFRELFAERDAGMQRTSLEGGGLGGFGGGGGGGGFGGGGRGGGGGGSFTGNAGVGHWWTKDRVEHGIERLMKESHLTRAGAEGLVSRWATVEAPGGPTSVNPHSGAIGIIQALGDRKAGFGPGTSYDDQLTAAIHQLNTSEKRAGDVLRRAQNAHEAAVGGSMFERAEGYNRYTGTDNSTSKSEAGNANLGKILRDDDGNNLASDGSSGRGAFNGAAGTAFDHAAALLGQSGSEVARRLGAQMHPGEWCADFVNGALKSAGIQGTNSGVAQSFANWGHAVGLKAVKKGDVIVDGEPAGHVSFATGATRMHNGRLQIQTLNGNWGHSHGQSRVKYDWLNADSWVHARRANGLSASGGNGSGGVAPHPGGHVRVDMHMHQDGTIRKHSIQSTGMVQASLNRMQRWPAMSQPEDV